MRKSGLVTPFPTPTPVAAGKSTLAAIPELYCFTLCGDVEGYETVESNSNSNSTSRIVSAMFAVSGGSGRKKKEKEDSNDKSDDESRFLGENLREGRQEMAKLCRKMIDAKQGAWFGSYYRWFLTSVRWSPPKLFG